MTSDTGLALLIFFLCVSVLVAIVVFINVMASGRKRKTEIEIVTEDDVVDSYRKNAGYSSNHPWL